MLNLASKMSNLGVLLRVGNWAGYLRQSITPCIGAKQLHFRVGCSAPLLGGLIPLQPNKR